MNEAFIEEMEDWMDYFIKLFERKDILFDDATNKEFREFIKKYNSTLEITKDE